MTTAEILARLEGVKGGDGQWTARCPAHDDNRNSLSITAGPDGRTLIRCHAGCTSAGVALAAGMELSDLFSQPRSNGHHGGNGRQIVATYDYCDAFGKLLYQAVRYEPKDFRQRRPDGNGGWIHKLSGVDPVPYRLPALIQSADHDRVVYVVEGEKDADRLAAMGLTATCNSGGAGKWRKEFAEHLVWRHVVILPDNDNPGEKHAEEVARSLVGYARSIKVLRLPGLPAKGDVSDWLAAGGSKKQLEQLAGEAPKWSSSGPAEESRILKPLTFGDLAKQYPEMRPIIVDGLLRQGETMNLIAPPKVGKSWLAYNLALSIVTGREWLDTFACTPGKVLILDNELHPETIAHRLPVVAEAMGLRQTDYESSLHVLPLRGQLLSLLELDRVFDGIERGEYQLVIGDSWYRFYPEGVSENDNAQMAALYNKLDQLIGTAACSWCGIHHTSRGQQGEKSVTDTGAGAGAQSRAADTHAVLRPHEEENTVVLEAAVRSFKPLAPLAIRWAFPLWLPDGGVDVTKLKGRLTVGEQRTSQRDIEGKRQVVDALRQGPATIRVLRERTGLSRERCERLVNMLRADNQLTTQTITKKGNETLEYSIRQDVGDE
ncbi:Regulatory protein RepA [Caulifigura coniformis]|uniref:Regulatory protein RepA n=1 Tax=Caulifigura coniformis TaxID=2527983 RepID=A0A517SLA4_9PLAN|nr:AAA family ATPase [Caulifigura coniformis]QDT56897.1 Regulatory protein RepA [Caulifigura coniformis]